MAKGIIPIPPGNPPSPGEMYQHYKGDNYMVVGVALHSNEDIWMVVYKPLYEADAELFTRPLSDWREEVEWQGEKVSRFTHVSE